jgi:hypothetical protein
MNMNIRFKLILEGILPAMTDDYEDQYITFAKKHSDIIATDYVIHEYRKTFVLYNKQYQKLIDNCKGNKRNEKAFGKLLGYTEPMGLLYMFNNTDMKLIGISYYLDKDVFLTYYKMQKNTDMKKELRLLEKMKDIDWNIGLDIVFENNP